MSTKVAPDRTTFYVTYLIASSTGGYTDMRYGEVSLFYNEENWWTDDDLARNLISVIENELRQEIYLVSWGVEPTNARVEMEQL